MAIKNYLTKNSYTYIHNIIYEKSPKRCTVVMNIYSDETKTLLLANKGITVDGDHKHISLLSLNNKIKELPSELSVGMHYLIDENPDADLLGYEGQLTAYNSVTKNWDKWVLWNGLIVFVEDEKKYYIRNGDSWTEHKDFTADKRLWDKWFAPEVALADGTNPTKQMYKFMKTLDQFKDCKDV